MHNLMFTTAQLTVPTTLRHGLSLLPETPAATPAWAESDRAVNRHPEMIAMRREVLATLEEVLAIFDAELHCQHRDALQ